MIHTYFDHTYVINIPLIYQDRLNLITHQCAQIGLEFEVFPGVDGYRTDFTWDETNTATMPGWTKGAAGLVYTTINIINDAKAKGYKNILILEDDLIFKPNTNKKVEEAMASLPSDWELFHFAATHHIQPDWSGNRLIRLNGSWSCQMYAINSSIYDLYLEELQKVDKPIDVITSEIFHPRSKSYAINPSIIETVPNFSTIRNRFINHSAE